MDNVTGGCLSHFLFKLLLAYMEVNISGKNSQLLHFGKRRVRLGIERIHMG